METVRLDREIHRTSAPNGVTVLSERVATVRSAAMGVWVRTASAHEPRPKMGVSHVLEEISTVLDTPDDQVFDIAYETLWPEHSYGFQILGTRETVGALSADDLKQLHARAYYPGNCVIAGAGNFAHEALLEEVAKQGWFDRGEGSGGKN